MDMKRRWTGAACVLLAVACGQGTEGWIEDLEDGDPYVRLLAATALSEPSSGPTEVVVPALIPFLADPDRGVSFAASEAVLARCPDAFPILLQSLAFQLNEGASKEDGSRRLVMLLGIADPAVLPEALSGWPFGQPETRQNLAGVLDLREENSGPVLHALLTDPHPGVRLSAVEALHTPLSVVGVDRAELLIPLLDDPVPVVRRGVAEALAAPARSSGKVVEALLSALGDDVPIVQSSLLKAVVPPLLSTSFAAPEEEVRAKAATFLLGLGQEAEEGVLQSLKDRDTTVADAAVQWIASKGVEMVLPLLDAFNEREFPVYSRASLAVRALGEEAVEPLLRELVDEKGHRRVVAALALGALGQQAGGAQDALLDALKGDDHLAVAAAVALGQLRIGDDAVLEGLEARVATASKTLRSATLLSLVIATRVRLRGGSAAQAEAIVAARLVPWSEAVLPILVGHAEDKKIHPSERALATLQIALLGEGGKAAEPILAALAVSEDQLVAEAASRALARLKNP